MARARIEPCPFGCLDRMCAAPETPIATDGERAIADLALGALVWSLERSHPTADGQTFAHLAPGDELGGLGSMPSSSSP